MNIGIIGYGKMGKEIEKISVQKGHQIVFKIDSKNKNDLNRKTISETDVAIEFSNPHSAFNNICFCIKNKIPVVSGTTGWLDKFLEAKTLCLNTKSTFLYAANFSVGINLFFEINNYVSKLMDKTTYQIEIEEEHHITKKDSPSGTAIMIANDICNNSSHLKKWIKEDRLHGFEKSEIPKVTIAE